MIIYPHHEGYTPIKFVSLFVTLRNIHLAENMKIPVEIIKGRKMCSIIGGKSNPFFIYFEAKEVCKMSLYMFESEYANIILRSIQHREVNTKSE